MFLYLSLTEKPKVALKRSVLISWPLISGASGQKENTKNLYSYRGYSTSLLSHYFILEQVGGMLP